MVNGKCFNTLTVELKFIKESFLLESVTLSKPNKSFPNSPQWTASLLMEEHFMLTDVWRCYLCSTFVLSLMYFHLQTRFGKKKKHTTKHSPRSERRKLCWQNEHSEVKTGTLCSLNVLSQQRRQPLSEPQLILLSPHQILFCFYISSTWLISDLLASSRCCPFIHSENFIKCDPRLPGCVCYWPKVPAT